MTGQMTFLGFLLVFVIYFAQVKRNSVVRMQGYFFRHIFFIKSLQNSTPSIPKARPNV